MYKFTGKYVHFVVNQADYIPLLLKEDEMYPRSVVSLVAT